MTAAIGQGPALLFLFVILPFLLAGVIAWLVQSRSEAFTPEQRTSHLLSEGTPATATLVDWRSPAQSFLDRHPMVTFRVEVDDALPFELDITQSVPRAVLRSLERGMPLDIRLADDRTRGAIVLG